MRGWGSRRAWSSLICVATLFAFAPAGAEGASDAASTHAFVLANYAFLKASTAKEGAIRKQIATESKSIVKQCGNEAAESPQDNESYEMSYEVAVALWSVSYGAEAPQVAKLSKAVSPLRWGNHAIARDVREYLKSLKELSHLAMPPVCSDLASWKASGFQVLPASTKQIYKRVEPIEIVPVPPSLLSRYASASDKTLLRRSEQLRQRLLNFETFVGANSWLSLLEKLELNN